MKRPKGDDLQHVPLIPATSASGPVREYHVDLEPEGATFVATCDRLPRWTAVADDVETLKKLAFDGIRFCLNDPSVTIIVAYRGSAS